MSVTEHPNLGREVVKSYDRIMILTTLNTTHISHILDLKKNYMAYIKKRREYLIVSNLAYPGCRRYITEIRSNEVEEMTPISLLAQVSE
jgi:phage anti-repressor protein